MLLGAWLVSRSASVGDAAWVAASVVTALRRAASRFARKGMYRAALGHCGLPVAFFVEHRTRRPKRVSSAAIIGQRLDYHARRSPVLIGASGRALIASDQPNFRFLLAL
jgi:hypothetical protein